MMANTLSPEMRRHIESLQFHCAMVGNESHQEPLNLAFVEKAIQECKDNGYTAIGYDLRLDGITEPMMIAIYKDGHIDSGSKKNVIECMGRRWGID